MHMYVKNNGSQRLSLLEKGVTNIEREKTGMNLVMLDWNQKY